MKNPQRIDFVIPWVDGNDPLWQSEFLKYKNSASPDTDSRVIRYRDWDNMQYWFRGVEKFAPWVGKIHFITWGHLPPWLDTSHPKLNIVKHTDYMPKEYLPTFSSIPIELNMHRIEGLAEHFVYFNDDMFLTRKIPQRRFFRGGLPCDIARLGISPGASLDVINKRHVKNKVIRKYWYKWINFRYSPSDIFKTLTLLPWKRFYGIKTPHTPQPFLRSTFEKLWQEEFDTFDATSRNKIRLESDISQYMPRGEQIATGKFAPHGCYDSMLCSPREREMDGICDFIEHQRGAMICITDADDDVDFESMKKRIKEAFHKILPDKSSYEL